MQKANQLLKIGNKEFKSRLLVGTGKYTSLGVMQQSLVNTKCEIVTVAVRRIQGLEMVIKVNGINRLEKYGATKYCRMLRC